MLKKLVLGLAVALASVGAGAADVEGILKRADGYRVSDVALEVTTLLSSFKGGTLDREQHVSVFTKSGGRSLVVFRSGHELGQKVLMVGDDFWLIVPTSQRPLRITALQKLLGDASTGDVATMTWSGDYTGEVVAEKDVGGVACLELELHAVRRSLSYQRIVLDVAKTDFRPVSAELYVTSNKLAKRAKFEVGVVDGRTQVQSMTLSNEIQTGQETVIRYQARRARTLPDEFFNPMFLTRAQNPE